VEKAVWGMSLKSIEMQIAIPRTGDAGNLQNQLLQKPVQDQAMLTAATIKQMEEKRKKSNEIAETSNQLKTDKDGHKDNQKNDKNTSKKEKENDPNNIEHPYKGHHIDLSL
jgi:hypothetical protein